MKQKSLAEFTDEELLHEAKKTKNYRIYDSVIVGFLAGAAIWSTVKNGLGLLTFLPIVYIPIAGKNNKRRKELERLLEERQLK